MHYPIQLVRINEGLSLFLPVQDEIKAVYEKTLSEVPDTPFPFWTKVWPASEALTVFLNKNRELINGKKVLEVGAGTAIPSFSIANAAASVIISDHIPDAILLMEKNMAHLELENATALCLDWNQFPATIQADTVLLSDINYAPEQFEPLLHLIKRFLQEGATVIIATPQRIFGAPFIQALTPYISRQEVQLIREVVISLLVLENVKN